MATITDESEVNRRDFLKLASASVTTLAMGGLANAQAAEPARPKPAAGGRRRPNILWYCTDQQRMDCMGAYGNKVIRTPNMDAFARSGVRFEGMFSQFPLCGPSRTCFLTGQYPQTNLNRFNGLPIRPDSPQLTRTLQANGYRTAAVGFWQLPPVDKRYYGLDKLIGHFSYNVYARKHGVKDPYPYVKSKAGGARYHGLIDCPVEHHATTWTADQAIEALEELKDGPFYLQVDERYPHPPYVCPTPYDKMYSPEDVPIAPSVPRDRSDFQDLKIRHALYYGMISLVDYNFGRILKKLDELGLADNTIVVFVTDHGDMIGHHNDFAKWALYDDDARLPFIIRYPGQPKAGAVVAELAEQIDIFPSLMQLTGIPVPRGVQGKSFIPVIEGHEKGKDAVYALQSYEDSVAKIRCRRQMIRTKDWKLVHMPAEGSRLFDMKNDPYEMRNLFDKPEHREKQFEMIERLLRWHLDTPDITMPGFYQSPEDAKEAKAWVKAYLEPCFPGKTAPRI